MSLMIDPQLREESSLDVHPETLVNPDDVHVENMKMLLEWYLRDKGYQLFEGDIFSGTKKGAVLFRKYALYRGYDPNTFEYITLHELSNAHKKYNEAYFDKLMTYPKMIEEHYTALAMESLMPTEEPSHERNPLIRGLNVASEFMSKVLRITRVKLSKYMTEIVQLINKGKKVTINFVIGVRGANPFANKK